MANRFLINILFIFAIFITPKGYSQETITWLKPIESDQKMIRNKIVSGSSLDLMSFLAKQLPHFNHQFEAYPIKRNWALIQQRKITGNTYCFWGADYKVEREQWGYFTKPTSVSLPYMIAARKGELSQYVNDGAVSVTSLLRAGFATVIFDNVVNPWTKIVEQAPNDSLIEISGIDKDLSEHTLQMIEIKRIDFGYISHRTIANLDLYKSSNIELYEIEEMIGSKSREAWILCSKTPQGKKVVSSIDKALNNIFNKHSLSMQMKELVFKAEGYPQRYKSLFDKQWDSAFNLL